MTEHPKNETEWSDDDHMERIFAAWVQSRPTDAAATAATATEAPSPGTPPAGPTNGRPTTDERSSEEPEFPRSLAKKTSLPDWFVDEPSTPELPPDKPAAVLPEPVVDEGVAFPEPWDDDPSSPDSSDEEPGSPAPEATSKGAGTSTGWTRTDDDVIPKGGKRRWGRKGR